MSREIKREFELVSLVFTFTSKDRINIAFDPEEIEDLEKAVGEIVQLSQVSSDAGLGSGLTVRRDQMDISVYSNRIEVRSLQPTFSHDVADKMLTLVDEVSKKIEDVAWHSAGHNFIISSRTGEPTVEHLGGILLRDDIDSLIGYHILGAAPSLWMSVDESTLLLRLQPHRNSTNTDRISANANFSVSPLEHDELPSLKTTKARLIRYESELDKILGTIGI